MSGKTGRIESMTDVVGNRMGFNTVSHTVEDWWCPLVETTYKCYLNSPFETEGEVVTVISAGAAYAAGLNLSAAPWLGSDEEMRLEALSQMHPKKVKTQFDASLELGELIEGMTALRAFFSQIDNLLSDLTRLNRWNSPEIRRIFGQKTLRQFTWKDFADLAISADLSYQLAIRPFLDLLKRLKKADTDFWSQLQRVVSSETTLHGKSIREVETSSSFTTSYHKGGNVRKYTKLVTTSARIRYHSPKITGMFDAYWRSYYGLTPTGILPTAYELMPFTFVLDWFWNFGKFLRDSLNKPVDDISYSVLWTGWSRKITSESTGTLDLLEGTYGTSIKNKSDPNSLITGTVKTSSYLREAMVLDLEAGVVPTPKIALPSLGQLRTLAELVYMLGTDRRRFIEIAQRVPVGG